METSELKKANNMWMTLEEYKKLPKCLDREDYENVIWYTYSVAKGEDYDEAIDYIVENHIRNPDERIQANAIGALYDVVIRFYDMKDNVMPFLAESLVSSNKEIRGHAFDVLGKIEHLVPRLKKTIHSIFFSQKLDFFADKELKVYTNKLDFSICTTDEEKEEFILSFSKHSNSYDDIWDLFISVIQSSEDEEIIETAFAGPTYLVMRFERIDFDELIKICGKFITYENIEKIYAKGHIYNIAAVIPSLRERCLSLLDPLYREELKWDWQK